MHGIHSATHHRILTAQECRNLLEELRTYRSYRSPEWKAILLLLINYGARVSEVTALTWANIDFEAGTVTLPTYKRWKVLADGRKVRVPLSRTLPLLMPVRDALVAYRKSGAQATDRIFFVDRRPVYRVFQTLLKRAGIAPHRLHDLRHSCATRFLEATGDLVATRDLLGHASIATTGIYLHATNLRRHFLSVEAIA